MMLKNTEATVCLPFTCHSLKSTENSNFISRHVHGIFLRSVSIELLSVPICGISVLHVTIRALKSKWAKYDTWIKTPE
jgi:hypothetical protein